MPYPLLWSKLPTTLIDSATLRAALARDRSWHSEWLVHSAPVAHSRPITKPQLLYETNLQRCMARPHSKAHGRAHVAWP